MLKIPQLFSAVLKYHRLKDPAEFHAYFSEIPLKALPFFTKLHPNGLYFGLKKLLKSFLLQHSMGTIALTWNPLPLTSCIILKAKPSSSEMSFPTIIPKHPSHIHLSALSHITYVILLLALVNS